MNAQRNPSFDHIYIDAFAGAGKHISKATGDFVQGSPLNALLIKPPFKEYHFIDLNPKKVDSLRDISKDHPTATVHHGDCNKILLEEVFPRAKYEKYKRALCLLDPYGLHLDWTVMITAGQMKSMEIFLNFPVMDMNMNVLWENPDRVDPEQAARMTAFWGDESWKQAAYNTTGNLFGWAEKTDNETVAKAFQERLKKVAGFSYVPEPMPMRNRKGAIVYYLFFASRNPVAKDIVTYIFNKYRSKGVN